MDGWKPAYDSFHDASRVGIMPTERISVIRVLSVGDDGGHAGLPRPSMVTTVTILIFCLIIGEDSSPGGGEEMQRMHSLPS